MQLVHTLVAPIVVGVLLLSHTPEAVQVSGCPAAAKDCSEVQRQLDHSIDPSVSGSRYNYTFSIYNTWDVHCNLVIKGQDFGETPDIPIEVKDIGQCAKHCEEAGKLCEAFSYLFTSLDGSGSCFLKTYAATQNWELISNISVTSSTPGLTDGHVAPNIGSHPTCVEVATVLRRPKSCVGDDRSVQCKDIPSRLTWYGYANPNDWSVYCNIDIQNHDLGSTVSSNGKTRILSACAQQCTEEPKCQAFTFVFGRNKTLDNDCFLKTSADVTDFSMKEGAYWNLREQEVRCVQFVTGVKRRDTNMCAKDVRCITALALSIIACLKALIDILLLEHVRRAIGGAFTAVGINVAPKDGGQEGVSKSQQLLAFCQSCLGHVTTAGGKATDTSAQLQKVHQPLPPANSVNRV